jgi:hypothetical protein
MNLLNRCEILIDGRQLFPNRITSVLLGQNLHFGRGQQTTFRSARRPGS